MSLSPRVSQSPPRISPSGKAIQRDTASPFGGLNQTEARIRGVPERSSAAEQKRSGKEGKREGWKPRAEGYHALKMQRTLAAVSYGQRASIKDRIQAIESFEDFPLLPLLKDSIPTQALQNMEDVRPTPVQRLAIPALLGNENTKKAMRTRAAVTETREMEQYLLAAETGSGKTLAYLLPVIDAVKRAEALDQEVMDYEEEMKKEKKLLSTLQLEAPPLSNTPHPTTGRPRAIILLPTSELVTQVGALVKSLSHTVKFRSAMISSAYSGQVIRNRLFSPSGIDILISTPHLLSSIADSDPNILSRVTHLVIDEADSLLDRSFSPLTSAVIDKATPSLQQLILCSATIPRSLDSFLRRRFPEIRRLTTPNLHAIPRRVQLGVVDVEKEPYQGNKNLAAADTIWAIGKAAAERVAHSGPTEEDLDVKRIIVFVNEREKAQEVADYLVSKGIDASALTRDTPEQRQTEVLSAFTSVKPPAKRGSKINGDTVSGNAEEKPAKAPKDIAMYMPVHRTAPLAKRHLPNTKVLVSTDLGSRGIDTLAVRHVMLYDVPHTTIDFIHRLGRTGRMGRRGRGIVLVGKGDRRDVVREVREGMYMGKALI
jgi:ATP-dependent RNA helicase MRH4